LTVRERLALPFQEVLSFWMPLEIRDVTDHLGDEDTVALATYSEVFFRNPAVLAAAGQVFVPLNVNVVVGATDEQPIVITTASPHGYQDFQQVSIEGVLGNTAANGTWEIVVLSATEFNVYTSGNGAYTGGGTATGVLSGNSIAGVSVVAGASDAAP